MISHRSPLLASQFCPWKQSCLISSMSKHKNRTEGAEGGTLSSDDKDVSHLVYEWCGGKSGERSRSGEEETKEDEKKEQFRTNNTCVRGRVFISSQSEVKAVGVY